MTIHVAQSTLAMSAVSSLAVTGSAQRDVVIETLALYYSLQKPDVELAVDEAISRGLIKVDGDQLFSILPRGYAVRERDRSGDGWGKWVAVNLAGQKLVVADLLGGA